MHTGSRADDNPSASQPQLGGAAAQTMQSTAPRNGCLMGWPPDLPAANVHAVGHGQVDGPGGVVGAAGPIKTASVPWPPENRQRAAAAAAPGPRLLLQLPAQPAPQARTPSRVQGRCWGQDRPEAHPPPDRLGASAGRCRAGSSSSRARCRADRSLAAVRRGSSSTCRGPALQEAAGRARFWQAGGCAAGDEVAATRSSSS